MMIVWLTGLPCSGKTTLAQALKRRLTIDGVIPEHHVELLDGDSLRATHFAMNAGFSPEDRHAHLMRVGYLAKRLAAHVPFVICSFVLPAERTRHALREFGMLDVLVHVNCPAVVCEQRDVKGMWAKARAGQLTDFTGVDSTYDTPEYTDVVVHTHWMSVSQCVEVIMDGIRVQRARGRVIHPTLP